MVKRSLRILVATSVHLPHDTRIVRQLLTLSGAGHNCTLLAPWAGDVMEYQFRCCFFRHKSGLGGRLLAQFMFLRLSLFQRWDVIHFHDFDLTPAAILVRILTWQRVIYDVHENYADEVMVRGYIPTYIRPILKHIVNAVEWAGARIIRRAVVVVPVQVERFARWGCPQVALVRNFAPRSFAPLAINSIVESSKEKFVLNTGSQSIEYGALMVLRAAAHLNNTGSEIRICGIDRFQGNPGLRDEVLNQIKIDAPNYILLPRVPYQEVDSYLRQAIIGLSVMLDRPNKKIAYPTKLFEYMAYGIPIIATDVGYQAEIIKSTRAGILVPPDDAVALAKAIAELWKDREQRARLGQAGRDAFFSRYCWDTEANELLRFYDEIAS